MNSELKRLIEGAKNYEFDPELLDAIPITGTLRKSQDPKNCILVISNKASGDLIVEIELDDIVKHEIKKKGENTEYQRDQVKLYIKPTAIVTTSLKGKIANSLITSALLVDPISRQLIRILFPEFPVIEPASLLDRILFRRSRAAWQECLSKGVRECRDQFPPGPDRDRCIINAVRDCGDLPSFGQNGSEFEQFIELFRGPIF
jgi:hypothetical protein